MRVSEVTGREILHLTAFGRSLQPLKDLLADAREFSLSKNSKITTIWRPQSRTRRDYGYPWRCATKRPSRPIESVLLTRGQRAILHDVDEFLNPRTRLWYAERGIPWRRGYLLHGKAGTGKTSLSFSVAGVFGLDIYCLSLQDSSLTEEDLNNLFSNLPRRCVVLLEDIDCAGVRMQKNVRSEELEALKDTDSSPISLAALLQVIDGAAASEGRVLFMTTNFLEKLDQALIRPGRVDMKIEFTLATKMQVREIYSLMYSTDRLGTFKDGCSKESIPKMAAEFADTVPEATVSPAELLGFLLQRKEELRRALSEVKAWLDSNRFTTIPPEGKSHWAR